jgi:hypothetical protein
MNAYNHVIDFNVFVQQENVSFVQIHVHQG